MWFSGFLCGAAVGVVFGGVVVGVLISGAWAATDHARADLDSMDCPRPVTKEGE